MSAERDPGQWWVRFGHGVGPWEVVEVDHAGDDGPVMKRQGVSGRLRLDQPACEWGPYIGTGPRKDGA